MDQFNKVDWEKLRDSMIYNKESIKRKTPDEETKEQIRQAAQKFEFEMKELFKKFE